MAGVGGSVMGMAGDIMQMIAASAEDEKRDRYNAMIAAYQREADRIAKENKRREEAVNRRRQLSSAIGSKQKWLEPQYEQAPSRPDPYEGSESAEALSNFANIVKMVGGAYDMAGGGMGGSSGVENVGAYMSPVSETDINMPTNAPSSDTALAYMTEPYGAAAEPGAYRTMARYQPTRYTGTSLGA